MKYQKEIVSGVIILVVIVILVSLVPNFGKEVDANVETDKVIDTTFDDREVRITEDGIKYIVDPSKIRSGGPPQDGIPSIDDPKFVSVSEADFWIADNELVLLIEYDGERRVYPLQILVWHEIVNDVIGGEPVLITYCPLCGSGIAYKGEINGERVEFGTSGKLYNSNLVMYDRLTETYWTQIDGVAIIGELTGMELEEVSIDTVSWRDFKANEENLDSGIMVLSQDTGYNRDYGRDPYGSYYEDSNLFFPVENQDDRIHAKDVIFGIEVDGVFKAYREVDLLREGKIEDSINGVSIEIMRSVDGIVTILDTETGEEIVKERDFWFAWYAFHPDTQLYGFDE